MKVEFQGVTYRIRFKHEDYRKVVEIRGKTYVFPPAKGKIQAKTTCRIVEVQGDEDDPKRPGQRREVWVELAAAEAFCSIHDNFNRAHGRWYAFERALEKLLVEGAMDDETVKFVRVLRKAYYSQVRWRPDGKDGYVSAYNPPELLKTYEVNLV